MIFLIAVCIALYRVVTCTLILDGRKITMAGRWQGQKSLLCTKHIIYLLTFAVDLSSNTSLVFSVSSFVETADWNSVVSLSQLDATCFSFWCASKSWREIGNSSYLTKNHNTKSVQPQVKQSTSPILGSWYNYTHIASLTENVSPESVLTLVQIE